jgi:hypothetical protein
MATTIDHLSADHSYTVIQDFTDAEGVTHRVGEQGVIIHIGYNFVRQEITITWKRDGNEESMVFRDADRTGPGNGRMKQYFEKGEYVFTPIPGRRFIPNFGYAPEPPQPPELTDTFFTKADDYDRAMDRVWALASRKRFEEANEQLRAIVYAKDRLHDNVERAAADVCSWAYSHAFDDDLTVHLWLRGKGISLWYEWGSGATSGGEGMARSVDIREAEAKFAALDKKLGR